jgi:hypothetical protein
LFVSADLNQLSSILRKGTYPLIDISRPTKPGNALCLQLFSSPERADGTTTTPTPVRYVATSHVWSDGLGNAHRNSIPACQLSKLSKLVRNVLHSSHPRPYSCFWIDTICCPIEDGSEMQNLAIHKMKDTYEKASAVLVFGASLMAQTGRR